MSQPQGGNANFAGCLAKAIWLGQEFQLSATIKKTRFLRLSYPLGLKSLLKQINFFNPLALGGLP